jgi:hypothetical protein
MRLSNDEEQIEMQVELTVEHENELMWTYLYVYNTLMSAAQI